MLVSRLKNQVGGGVSQKIPKASSLIHAELSNFEISNIFSYTRPRISQYNEDDFWFQFLIFTELSESETLDILTMVK